jgi:CheY-like chemotaxis protein
VVLALGIEIAHLASETLMPRIILVADDEPDLVVNCERLLNPLGHICLRASGGLDAIAHIDRESPDLVVTDLRLPGADGLAVARHANAHVPPIPVILMTGYDSAWARRAAREVGVAGYLAKPFTNAAFLDAIRRVLTGSPPGPGDGSRA